MHTRTYRHPYIHKWDSFLFGLLVILILLPVFFLFYYGYFGVGFGVLILLSIYLSWTRWRILHTPEIISVTDVQIEARWPNGKELFLSWDQIGEVRQFQAKLYFRLVKIVRIISVDRRQEFMFTELLDNFNELMDQIRTKAPGTRIGGKLNVLERIVRWL